MILGVGLFNLVVTETDLYYYQQNNNDKNEPKKNKVWIDTNIEEMKTFLGFLVRIVKELERFDYWSNHPLLYTSISGNIITKNRSQQL